MFRSGRPSSRAPRWRGLSARWGPRWVGGTYQTRSRASWASATDRVRERAAVAGVLPTFEPLLPLMRGASGRRTSVRTRQGTPDRLAKPGASSSPVALTVTAGGKVTSLVSDGAEPCGPAPREEGSEEGRGLARRRWCDLRVHGRVDRLTLGRRP